MESPREPHKARRETKFGIWEEGDATLFWVRGPTYLDDAEKIQVTRTPVMRLIHLDLFQGPKPQDHVFPIVRDSLQPDVGVLNSKRDFYVIMNFIVRGKDRSIDKKKKVKGESWINWIFYFAIPEGAREDPENEKFFQCFDAFLAGDDKERNHRMKVILSVAEGPWIVKAAIGGGKDGSHKGVTPTLVGEKVTTTYHQGDDYIEIAYNTAIDAVAVTSAKLAFQHSQKLVVDLGVVFQAETAEELPERIAGVVRCSNFVIGEAVIFPGTVKGTYRIKEVKELKEGKEENEEKEEKDKREKKKDKKH